MMPNQILTTKKDFIQTFNKIAKHKYRYQVFEDFVKIYAIFIHNSTTKNTNLEQEYLSITKKYTKQELSSFTKLYSNLVSLLKSKPQDILGELYMELELGNKETFQFFTPAGTSTLLAETTLSKNLGQLDDSPFIILSEPTCGSGGVVLSLAKTMMDRGHNPASTLFVSCIDINKIPALMCYLQLSLLHIPAEITILENNPQEIFYTPAYYMGGWEQKLLYRQMTNLMMKDAKPLKTDKPNLSPKKKAPKIQLDFGF